MRTNIKTPDNKISMTFLEALNEFNQGKKVLVELKDSYGVYAAHAFSVNYGHIVSDVCENQKYIESGYWYVLPE